MSEPREIEAKYEADPRALEHLLAIDRFGEWQVEHFPEKVQMDVYFDSPDESLKDAGASLRLRRRGSAVLMTFKGDRVSAGTAVSRLEDEVSVDLNAAARFEETGEWHGSDIPSPLARAHKLTGDVPLVAFAGLQTARARMIATHPGGGQVELALDRCQGIRKGDGRVVSFIELEVELKQGGIDHLVLALDQLVATVPGLRPTTVTKLERALR